MIRPRSISVVLVLAAFASMSTACADDDTVDLLPPADVPERGDPPPENAAEVERRIERHIFDQVNIERQERGWTSEGS